jgi:hypothetical protein
MTPIRRFRLVRDANGRPHLHDVDDEHRPLVAETRAGETALKPDPRPLGEQLMPPYGPAA